jgi:putative transposase
LSLTDFLLSERGDLAAAGRLPRQAITPNGVPDRVVIGKSGAKLADLQAVNVILKFTGGGHAIKIKQVKYLNKFLEQPSRGFHANPSQVTDHRFIKRITAPMSGFKAFHSAAASIAGIEIAHMIRKGQFAANKLSPFQQFAAFAS